MTLTSRGNMESLMQIADSEFQPQAKEVVYESKSGGIIEKIEEMKEKVEETLTTARAEETKAVQDYDMLEQSLSDGIKVAEDKIGVAKTTIGAKTQEMNEAKGDLTATKAAKAADEKYLAELKHECEETAANWGERQESAKAEMEAINKAIEILSEGVRVLLQTGSHATKRTAGSLDKYDKDFDDDAVTPDSSAVSAESNTRSMVVNKLKDLSHKFGSYALMQMASAANSDPFVKIRGLIEDMIAKLLKEAEEEATQKAFCDAEMGKSKTSQEQKTMTLDKLSSRIDGASSTIAELTEAIKTLESEIAAIDKAQAEATEIRTTENADYMQASSDFKSSAEAVAKAIEVLKNFYEGSFLQVSSKTSLNSKQPEFGGAKSDIAHTIISVLEMSEEDFTTLLAETEATEDAAKKAYEKLTDENKVSKATKQTEAKGKASEVKSLTVQLAHSKEDHASISSELDAVNAYIDKLRPQCEEKVMSYEEKKAKREAEIAGLKEALGILSGDLALTQTSSLRGIRRV